MLDKKHLLDEFKKFDKLRIKPAVIFDQTLATCETVVNRILIMANNNDMKNKKIIFIGDDDFMSVCAAITGLPKKITVVDIDPRVTDSAKEILKSFDIDFSILTHDLRKELSKELLNEFDIFFTDPAYTEMCIELFTLRGFECIKNSGYGYACIPSKTFAENIVKKVIANFAKMNIKILQVWEDMNQYNILGQKDGIVMPQKFTSSLLKLEGKNVHKLKRKYDENIYAHKAYESLALNKIQDNSKSHKI